MTLPKPKTRVSNEKIPDEKIKTPDKNIFCNLCDVRFTQKKALYVHLRNKHHIEPLEKKQGTVECPQCKNMFYDKYNLRRHCRRVHGASPIREEKRLFLRGRVIDTDRKPTFILSIEENYSQRSDTYVESNSCSDEITSQAGYEIIICDMCQNTFNSKNNLIRHISDIHSKNQNLKCVECSVNFQDRLTLLHHTHPLENYSNLQAILPEVQNYKYEIAQQVKINDMSFIADIYCNLCSREDANKWLDKFQRKNKVTFRKMRRQCQSSEKSYVFIIDRYRCQHNTLPKRRSIPHAKHTGCSATLFIRVYQHKSIPELSWARIRIKHTHNHMTEAAAKFRDPVEEVVNKFRIMFEAGKGPKAALNEHIKDLQLIHGDDVISDRGICPSSRWVYNFYRKMSKERYDTNCEQSKSKPRDICKPNHGEKFTQNSISYDAFHYQKSTPMSYKINEHHLITLSPPKDTYQTNSVPLSSMNSIASSDKFLTCQANCVNSNNDYQHPNIAFPQQNIRDGSQVRENQCLIAKPLDQAKLVLDNFDQIINQIRSRVSLDPVYFLSAMKNFIQTYNTAINTPEALNSAICTFGKYSDFEMNSL